jgi:predicted O-methyltransferase YrrM
MRAAARGRAALAAPRDLRRLEIAVPALRDLARTAESARENLAASHREYVETVSDAENAMSLELAGVLDAICELLAPRRIADLGSGFSSFVIRRYADRAERPPDAVVSVDDDVRWLDRTRDYLTGHGLDASNVETWDTFSSRKDERFDLIFDDFSGFQVRVQTLGEVLERLAPDGMAVLDDLHTASFRSAVALETQARGLRTFSLRSLTRDRFSRYAVVALPHPGPSSR